MKSPHFVFKHVNALCCKDKKTVITGGNSPADYKAIKADSEKRIMEPEAKLMKAFKHTNNIETLLNKAATSLVQLDQLYAGVDVKRKRQVIGSILPENTFLMDLIIKPRGWMKLLSCIQSGQGF